MKELAFPFYKNARPYWSYDIRYDVIKFPISLFLDELSDNLHKMKQYPSDIENFMGPIHSATTNLLK